ncbi:ACT domain-containing protein [Alkalicoccobacillus gibsonii]|uniref:ACT domain-containing protein n=1 Tax=Alkalicoccobacillus gibsonii TaxID=79881 RepID=UPI001933CB74|nr:ACT domain-containing protein [Alkalicoccobacillus gibsonii]MBM0064140.1 ACT domain-containing protein [Alkalicoccobacillus gibsonii]
MSARRFFLIREDILTDAMIKTLEAKSMLQSGEAKKINEAAQKVGLSRSAFYKYKDGIFPFHAMAKEKIVTLSINLLDKSGTLSELLMIVANTGANILTINQTIPLQGRAHITLSIDTAPITMQLDELFEQMKKLKAVEKVELAGSG